MTDWNPPRDDALSSGSVGLSAHIIAIRDLPAALARRADGAPWLNGVGATEIINTSRDWVVPDGVHRLKVVAVGGGGAGGTGHAVWKSGLWSCGVGGGGGAGALAIRGGLEVSPGETLSVSIGAGGIGTDDVGGSGGATVVRYQDVWRLVCEGGAGGESGTYTAQGGAGATMAVNTGISGAMGGAGLAERVRLDEYAGNSGPGAASVFGGGAPGVVTNSNGRSAAVPGAGGSGGLALVFSGSSTSIGGSGASGLVIIEY